MAKFEKFTVDEKTKEYMKKKAETQTIFASLLENVEEYGSLTKSQMAIIERERARDKELQNRPKMKDENGELGPINNQSFLDGKPKCWIRGCKQLAKVRVDGIGVCPDHVEEGHAENEAYAAKRAALA